MGKVIEIIDLLNMVFKKEIKDKQKIRVTLGNEMTRDIYYVESEGCNICCFKHCSDNFWWSDEYNLNDKVEILDEEQQDIDIQKIEVLPEYKVEDVDCYDCNSIKCNRYAINDLIKAVKQLDKQIKDK